jgi:DNA-binding response OmpR family regulator
VTLLRFPTASAAPDDWHMRRDPAASAGAVLVIASPDQGALPNLGFAGLRATFADSLDVWNGRADADVLLICAGERRSPEFQDNVREAQARGIPVIVWGDLSTNDRIAMLEAGVQDVVSTDCHPQEFRARLQVQLRRRTAAAQASATWRLAMASRSLISPDGSVIHFSPALTEIMRMLAEANGEVVKREDLARAFYERLSNRALDAQVSRLRRKLGGKGCRASLHSVKGLGYSLRFLDGPVLIEA